MYNVVILGGGFAGVRCAQELYSAPGYKVTLVDRKDYFEVSFAQLAALVEPNKIGIRSRFTYTSFLKCDYINKNVQSVTRNQVHFVDNQSIDFDILVIATGSHYKTFSIGKPDNQLSLEDRNSYFLNEHNKLEQSEKIVIIGGGPVGVELAGEIASKFHDKKIVLVHGSNRILEYLSEKASRLATDQLQALGVEVILNEKLESNDNQEFHSVSSKTIYTADLFYNCIGSKANTGFLTREFKESLNERGLIRVDKYFRVMKTENIYAIGDCNDIQEAKLGSLASRQGALLAKNLIRQSRGQSPVGYNSKKTMAIVPIGRDNGVVQLPIGVFTSKTLIHIKTRDFFIKKYSNLFGIN
ncbi:MAG: FAD-dependent oxidoreductase [Eubacteriales bacterium]